MTSVRGIFRILCLLFVQSVIWSMCVCKPINKEEISSRDDDLYGTGFSQKPFWHPTLRPPFDLPEYSWTPQPLDFYGKPVKNTSNIPVAVRVLIFVLIGIAGLVALLCKYFVCGSKSNNVSSESTPFSHPPPPERIPPTDREERSPRIIYIGVPIHTEALNSQIGNMQQFPNGTMPVDIGTSNTCDATDKPPSYSDVVTSDLIGGTLKFPDVSVANPRKSPPPKYGSGK